MVDELKAEVAARKPFIPDPYVWSSLTYRFHELILEGCGNKTMAIQGAVLQDIVATHLRTKIAQRDDSDTDERFQRVIRSYTKLISLVKAGNAAGSREALALAHGGRRPVPAQGRPQDQAGRRPVRLTHCRQGPCAVGLREREMDELTLAAHILAGAAAHDGCPLIFVTGEGGHATTLGALVNDAEKVAAALQARGIGPGDVVAVQLPGSYEGAVVQAAVGLCGAVLLPVVMIYGPREMGFVLSRSGATAVFLPREHRGRPHAAVVLGGLSGLPALKLASSWGTRAPAHGAIGYANLLGRPGGPYRKPSPDPDDRAVLMYTSGTTADPKGVQHSHRTLLAEATSRVYTHTGPGARHLGLFPPGHIAGLLSLLRILLLGTPTVIMQAWDAALAASLIDRHAVTSSGGAPVQLSGLLDQQAAGTAALATLREFLTGAAPVPPSLIRRADAAGITAYRSYGSSEHPTISAGTIADSLDQPRRHRRPAARGQPGPHRRPRRSRRAGRPGRRDPQPRPGALHRLHRRRAERGRVPARRVVPDRRRRTARRRRVPDGHRQAEGHHHPRRGEHLRPRKSRTCSSPTPPSRTSRSSPRRTR